MHLAHGCQPVATESVEDVRLDHNKIQAGEAFQYIAITEEDSLDHRGFRNNMAIHDIGFQLWVSNHGESPSVFQLYATDGQVEIYTDTDQIVLNALLIFDGPVIAPGRQTYFDWPASLPYVRNEKILANMIIDEYFTLYFFPAFLPDGLQLDSIALIITATY
jgi:hypothetical protein